MSEELLLTVENDLARITLNRPDRGNAILPNWPSRIADFLDVIERDASARCVLIEGRGRNFLSGGDLNMINAFLQAEPEERQSLCMSAIRPWNRMISSLQAQSRPVVASLQGAVVGPAIGLAAACDFAIAADDCVLIFAHVLNGGSIDGLLTYYLPQMLGPRRTLELLMLGEKLTADQALAEGIVSRVVPAAGREAEVDALVARLIAGPTRAYGEIRKLVRQSAGRRLEEQAELEAESCARLTTSTDWMEGVTAFLGRRRPVFMGR